LQPDGKNLNDPTEFVYDIGLQIIGIRKTEFVVKTQFLSRNKKSWFIILGIFYKLLYFKSVPLLTIKIKAVGQL